MNERKHKREPEPPELETEEPDFVLEPTRIEVGSGYTMMVSYDENDHPLIDVKIFGQVDLSQMRREIERAFPNAHIRQLNEGNTVTVAKKRRNTKK